MKRTALNILIAATTLAGMAQAQAPQQRVTNLADAQKVFRTADRNSDAFLGALELRAAGLGTAKLAEVDDDGDQRISRREFYVAFRKHLVAQGKTIGADLDAEVTRELAERRARKEREDAERRKQEAAKEQAKKDSDARRKGTKRIDDAKDEADAKERAEAQKRIRDQRRKAREEAERRRKDAADKKGEGPKKRPRRAIG